MKVNENVVKGFNEFPVSSGQLDIGPKYASTACLSDSKIAVWTNRVPQHEPWERQLEVDTKLINVATDEYKRNVRHNKQWDNDTEIGHKSISKIDGDANIDRGKFWRR